MKPEATIETVLMNEVDNEDSVYLYLEGNAWCAYERSAYYLLLMQAPIELRKEIIRDGYDVVLMKALFYVDDMYFPLSPIAILTQVSDNKLLFRLKKKNMDGFIEWKDNELKKLSA